MGVLRNSNWEQACQTYVLGGLSKVAAFRIAYPKNKSKKPIQSVRACEMFKKPVIVERVKELEAIKDKIANDEFGVNAAYVLKRLVDIDRMDVLDIMNDEGSLLPVSEWPLIWRQFIQQFEIEEIFAGRGDERLNIGLLKKIKWPDKIRNLELLGKHIDVSAFKENIGLTGPGGDPLNAPQIIVIIGENGDGK